MEVTKLYSYRTCQKLDELTRARGIPEMQLMGQAALGCLCSMDWNKFLKGRSRLVLLAGKGNNGGDGFALLYHLLGHPEFREYHKKNIIIYTDRDKADDSASGYYFRAVAENGIRMHPLRHFITDYTPAEGDTVIEALLGTGQRDTPKPVISDIINAAKKHKKIHRHLNLRYISIDVPAGLAENAAELIFPADEILSIGTAKVAITLALPSLGRCRVRVIPAGFDPPSMASLPLRYAEPAEDIKETLSFFSKKPDWHKYSAGYCVIAGGSRGMEGALILSTAAFFAAGGGIIRAVAFSSSLAASGPLLHPSVMWNSPEDIKDKDSLPFRAPDTFIIGPGLSAQDCRENEEALIRMIRNAASQRMIRNQSPPFIILDAAACSLVRNPEYPEMLLCRTLLTPHSGEWCSLGGSPVASTDSLDQAVSFSQSSLRCWVLIKNSVSVLIPPRETKHLQNCTTAESPVYIFARPQAALATAGTGDTLTGILAAAFSGARGHCRESAEQDCAVPEKVNHSLTLLHAAVSGEIHPSSGSFAQSIRNAFSLNGEYE